MPLGDLSGSKWATCSNQSIHKKQPIKSTGDWICSSCRTPNYYWRDECTKCNHKNSIVRTSQRILEQRQPSRPKDERLVLSKDLVFKSSFDVNDSKSRDLQHEAKYKNNVKRQQFFRSDQPISKGPDLPYQVQHCILTLMQKFLEEACYEFAIKWVPELLSQNGWDCVEAVELSQWKSFLLKELPKNAICPTYNYSLSSGLTNAVKIRNAAVHRHLCCNRTIQDMALQAKDLMSMFSDTVRLEKFYLLWVEIGEWDNNQKELNIAKAQLEQAIQITSERPMDRMDWTPNGVNSTEGVSLENTKTVGKPYYSDEMDLDM